AAPYVVARGRAIIRRAESGKFAEAGKYEAETVRLAEPTQHTHTIGWAYLAASVLHIMQGHWAQAHWLVEQGVNARRSVDIAVLLPWAITSSAWALAQIGELSEASRRVREAEALLEGQTVRGIVGHRSWGYCATSRACLLLGRLEGARRLGPRPVESSPAR